MRVYFHPRRGRGRSFPIREPIVIIIRNYPHGGVLRITRRFVIDFSGYRLWTRVSIIISHVPQTVFSHDAPEDITVQLRSRPLAYHRDTHPGSSVAAEQFSVIDRSPVCNNDDIFTTLGAERLHRVILLLRLNFLTRPRNRFNSYFL